MNYKTYCVRAKKSLLSLSMRLKMKFGQIKFSKRSKLVTSFVILLALMLIPAFHVKAPASQEIAKANSQSPTPSSTPQEVLNSHPSPQPKETDTNTNTPQPPKTTAVNFPKKIVANSDDSDTPDAQPADNSPQAQKETSDPEPTGILGYVNQARNENGLSSLAYNSQLNSAAQAKSQDMFDKNYFAHNNPDGKTDFDFIREGGYVFSFAGSNIAKGNFTEKSVFDAWMNSTGHRANILDPRAQEFGYGVAGNYFTMMVGAR